MSGDLVVTGGAGGISVALDDLDSTAQALTVLSRRCFDIAEDLARCALSPDLLASVLVAPLSGAYAHATSVRAAAQVGEVAARLARLGECVRLAVGLYRQADAVGAAAFRSGQDAVGFGVGVRLGLGWTAIALGIGGAAVVGRYRGPGAVVLRRAAGAVEATAGTAVGDTLARNPWLMSGAAGGVDGLAAGVAASGLAGSPLGLGLLAGAGPGVLTGSRRDLLGGVLASGPGYGRFDDGSRGRAVRLPAPITGTAGPARAPVNLADLATSMDEVGRLTTKPRRAQTDPWRSRVRVTRVPQPDGGDAWVVVIPGTQTWDSTAGPNPSDLTSSLGLLSGADPALTEAARDAMSQAGIAPGDPVLVAGHSQGGIAAAVLAADPDSPYTITHVYTEGSPIADIDIRPGVDVLAVEHAGDLVPALDDGPGVNPDRATWTTVTAAVPTAGQVRVPDEESLPAPLLAHESVKYQWTAAALDRSTDPSVTSWRDGASMFFRGRGTVAEYRMERVP